MFIIWHNKKLRESPWIILSTPVLYFSCDSALFLLKLSSDIVITDAKLANCFLYTHL